MSKSKRQTHSLIDTNKLDWLIIDDNLSYKHLNGDMENDEHTIILKSKSRKPNPKVAHFHPVNEEFYCLDGYFTFDGENWFKKNSYAYYPAYYVHGAEVYIKEGYLLYLRTNGKAIFEMVDKPLSNIPYIAKNFSSKSKIIQIYNINKYIEDNVKQHSDSIKRIPLGFDELSKTGSTLIECSKQTKGKYFTLKSENIIEIMFLNGIFKNNNMTLIYKNMYLCKTGKSLEITLRCEKYGKILVSHGSYLNIKT